MIKVKVEVASNEELVRSGGRKRNKRRIAEKKRERHRLACFSGGRRRTVDIEDG